MLSSLIPGTQVLADDGLAPSIPQSVTVQPASSGAIDIDWAASTDADGVQGYNIYRNGEFVASTNNTGYHDTNVSPNSRYHYWITATDTTNRESSTSRWVYTRTPATADNQSRQNNQRPPAPVDLKATLHSNGGVSLTWKPGENGGNIDGYNVYRNQHYIRTVKTSEYIDNNSELSSGDTYSVVSFTEDRRYSSHSESADVGTVAAPPPIQSVDNGRPAAATGLYSSANSDSSITLSWNRVSSAYGYNVYRDDTYIATVSDENYSDQGLSAGQTYEYTVVTFTPDKDFSTHSDRHSVTTQGSTGRRSTPQNNDSTRSPATLAAVGSDYQLAFSDEFNGNGLDLAKWNTAYLWGPDVTTNNESQYYVDIASYPDFGYQPFNSNGSTLSITANRTPDWLKNSANGKPYLSGVMTSYDSFQFTYGYAEARLRAPSGNGFFSAFWLLNARYIELEPEIDITDLLGENPYVVHHTYHHRDAAYNLVSTPTFDTWVDDFSRDFHTYAVRWSPGEIVWYVDGVETQRFTEGAIAAQPMYVLFNLAIDGDWPQSPDSNTVFPSSLDIDYVRVYRK